MLLGFDIGGTKCAAITAHLEEGEIQLPEKKQMTTDLSITPEEMLEKLFSLADTMLTETVEAVGISCGGPLDSARGIIMGPPNLPGWNHVEIDCSGGGLAQLGYSLALEARQMGQEPLYFRDGMRRDDISAKTIAQAARQGDETALRVYRMCGTYLGQGLSVLIDILNPQCIVIGSIFARSYDLLWSSAEKIISKEALVHTRSCCEVVPANLGEQIGDYAAIATALL